MLLNEIYKWNRDEDFIDYAKDVYQRLEKSGARNADHGPEMNELRDLIKEYEDELASDRDSNRGVSGGYDTAIGYITRRIVQQIDHLGYQVSASTGAGGFRAHTRALWNTKQEADPLSRKVRSMRTDMNNTSPYGDEDEDDDYRR